MSAIPPQHEVNWASDEEHFAWCLRQLPSIQGVGAITHPVFLRQWSKHLAEVGCVHVDYLKTLADEDGNIHVSKLPPQRKKFQEPMRGPYSHYNPAGRWVQMSEPEPQLMNIPDVTQLTQQENMVLVKQLIDAGYIQFEKPPQNVAEEVNGDNT